MKLLRRCEPLDETAARLVAEFDVDAVVYADQPRWWPQVTTALWTEWRREVRLWSALVVAGVFLGFLVGRL